MSSKPVSHLCLSLDTFYICICILYLYLYMYFIFVSVFVFAFVFKFVFVFVFGKPTSHPYLSIATFIFASMPPKVLWQLCLETNLVKCLCSVLLFTKLHTVSTLKNGLLGLFFTAWCSRQFANQFCLWKLRQWPMSLLANSCGLAISTLLISGAPPWYRPPISKN